MEGAVDLAVISPDDRDPSAKPDRLTSEELEYHEKAKKEVELEGLKQDIEERKIYAKHIYILVSVWLVGILILLMVQGFFSPLGIFNLSNSVLLAVIGGTTINVIGLFVVVARYLFPRR